MDSKAVDRTSPLEALLLRTHHLWSRILPSTYRPYRFPGGTIYLDLTESPAMVRRAFGHYEPERRAAIEYFLKPGQTFIDVGCNKGDFALLGARLVGESGNVVAFEPEPENCKWIAKSLKKSDYAQLKLEQAALSDENGEAQLYLGKRSGWHSLVGGQKDRQEGTITVKTMRLDDYWREEMNSRPVHLLKIDVEGADLAVLRGAPEFLRANPQLTVLMDVHPELGVDCAQVFRSLRDAGFAIYEEQPGYDRRIDADGPVHALVARRA